MSKKNQEYETELQWKNWLKYLNDTADAIEEIRVVGQMAYYDAKQLNAFYAKLSMFISTRKPYIEDFDTIDEELEKIGNTLFSTKYLNDMERGNGGSNLKALQYKMMKAMNKKILARIIENLSDYEILPKVTKQEKDVPGAVRNT